MWCVNLLTVFDNLTRRSSCAGGAAAAIRCPAGTYAGAGESSCALCTGTAGMGMWFCEVNMW